VKARLDPEVLLIEAKREVVEGDKRAARKTLKKAEERIDEMGCHRWDFEVKRLQSRLKE
jgi:outer membrane murein-binding lipoprotein Lpp